MGIKKGASAFWYSELSLHQLGSRWTVFIPRWTTHPCILYQVCATRVVDNVFGQILDPEFENDTSAFEETFMGAMRTHNLWMTPKEHVLVHHVPEYVHRTGVPLGSTSEKALET